MAEEEISREIKELETRIFNLKHKRARLSLYPPIRLGEENEINLLTNKEKEFKIEIKDPIGVGEYSAVITCDAFYREPKRATLTVNQHNEIAFIVIHHDNENQEESYRWVDSEESYIHDYYSGMYDRDERVNIKFKTR